MRIPSRIYQSHVRDRAVNGAAPGDEAAQAKQLRPRDKDIHVQVSGEARSLAAANRLDTERVAALKAAIADGTFTINPEAIALAIVE